MQFIYPAIIKENADGTFHATFPDLAGCQATGDDINDLMVEAQEAAFSWIDLEMHEDEPELPPVSDEDDLHLSAGEFVRQILVHYRLSEGWDE